MTNRIVLSSVIAAFFCVLTGAQAAGTNSISDASAGNPVIARGTGLEITRRGLDDAMAGIRHPVPPAQMILAQKQILNSLIDTKLLLAKATDADKGTGKNAADLQVTAAIENAGSQEAFDQRLKTNGLTEAGVRAKVTEEATIQAVLQRELKINVTDDDVHKFYDSHRSSSFETPEMARVSHILIFTVDPVTRGPLPADQQLSQRKLADELLKNIRAGVDFQALAKQYSEDPGSKENGGVLPPFPRGQMAQEIDDAAFSLTNNQVSGIIATSTGCQIIKVLERIPASRTPYLAAVPKIKEYLAQQQIQKLAPAYLESLKTAAGVEILDPDLKGTNAAPSSL
ncbi:MAG TPA: peptidylprolyl isomerase [Verrucomicrobiae bacterium]